VDGLRARHHAGLYADHLRLLRRQQRKSQHLQRAQLAAMQAMMAGQMKQP
jgi:hypothetical protein